MTIEQTAPEPIQDMLEPLEEGKFSFACHPAVPCFTECCRELKLLLTPYDVVRLKNHLQLSARDFLDRFTETRFDEQRRLPMVYLKMLENERRTCPFVSPAGCGVYADRPAACRIYPVARASRMHRVHGTVQENYFVLHESHCRGFEQNRPWLIAEWIDDQGLKAYHEMNNLWMEIITDAKLRCGPGLSSKQQQMFLLASYNMDKFREFVFQSRFLQLFDIQDEELKSIKSSDEALLTLAMKWLSFSLLNTPALKVRNAPAHPGSAS